MDVKLGSYYEEVAKKHTFDFLTKLEDLSTKIAANSIEVSEEIPVFSWYLHFGWRYIQDHQAINLALMLNYLNLHPELLLEKEKCIQFVGLESIQLIKQSLERFIDIKKMAMIIRIALSDKGVSFVYLTNVYHALLPKNEIKGNFVIDLGKWLEKNLTVRYNTPKKLKKPEFHRGYRDHGSMSTVSERARKDANKSHDLLLESSIYGLRNSPDPVKWAKSQGILPPD